MGDPPSLRYSDTTRRVLTLALERLDADLGPAEMKRIRALVAAEQLTAGDVVAALMEAAADDACK
jgi:hypothetical protein